MENIFLDIGLIIIIATIGGFIAKYARQPLLPIYILIGLLIGPVFGLITNTQLINNLSLIGVAFLLFFVGMEINLSRLKELVPIAVFGGGFATGIIFLIGYFLGFRLGFANLACIYLGMAVAFSSTMVVVKILADKNELSTLHGQISIGILVVQDMMAIFALLILTDLNRFNPVSIILILVKAIVIILLAILSARFLFPKLFKAAAKSGELLFLLSLSVCFFFSLVFQYFGLSVALGAFIGGITISHLSYTPEISARIKSLRDFFVTLFFVSIGLNLVVADLSKILIPLVIFLIVVIIVKPLIYLLITAAFGYKKRTFFMNAMALGQVSEFSLVIAIIGKTAGQISDNVFALIVLLAMISLTSSTYLLSFGQYLYEKVAPFLKFFEKENTAEELLHLPPEPKLKHHTILFGCDRVGHRLLQTLHLLKKTIIVVDFNPDVIKILRHNHIRAIYGDMSDLEILDQIHLDRAKMVISTVPNYSNNLLILSKIKQANHRCTIYLTADNIEDALQLYQHGADYVILPHFLSGERVSLLLEEIEGDFSKILSTKTSHIRELRQRQDGDVHRHV